MQVSNFLGSIGINTHIGSAAYSDVFRLDSMLDYTGITNVRQSAPTSDESLSKIAQLGQLGAEIDLIVNGNGPVNWDGTWANVVRLAPYLNAVEAPNEINLWPITYEGLGGVAAAIAFQTDLFAAVKTDATMAGIDVYSFSLGGVLPDDVVGLGDISAITDFANIHSYSPQGIRPSWVMPASVEGMATFAPDDPVVMTETGYYTLPGDKNWGGVTEEVQAKYSLNTLFVNASIGVDRTYFYDLVDDFADPTGTEREAHFGFYNLDGSAKQVATAFHNLTTIIADVGGDAAPETTLSYQVKGLPWTAGNMQLQKSDGSHIVALWDDQGIWDYAKGIQVAAEKHSVSLELDDPAATLRVYDPMLGTTPIAVYANVASIVLDLTDHPLLIEISNLVEVPEGDHQLSIGIAEDAYIGHAQFSVTVDGLRVGGIYTASASYAAGAVEMFNFSGNWGGGRHEISVQFLNDAWGGTPDTDRNLYVQGISLNGVLYADTSAQLRDLSPISFVINTTPPVSTPGPGPAGLVLHGDAGANRLVGTAGADKLWGEDGNDRLIGGAGSDLLDGGQGTDTADYSKSAAEVTVNLAARTASGGDANGDTLVSIERLYGSSFNDVLSGNAEANVLSGQSGDDMLDGGLGNDRLDGGRGADRLVGGAGNDIFVVDNAGDRAVEAKGAGIDLALSSISFSLGGQYIENLTLTGSGAINGTGNSLANVVTGNGSSNRLTGGLGNDTLIGGEGRDVLSGGAGTDQFVFNAASESAPAASGRDVITDWQTGDLINLSHFDANVELTGQQDFTFRGTAPAGQLFTAGAGDLWTYRFGGNTYVIGGVDSDGQRDFQVEISGSHVLAASDFIF